MIGRIKTLLTSKWLRVIFSVTLIYLAFRKIEIGKLIAELSQVNWFIVVLILIGAGLMIMLASWRWAMLVLPEVRFKDVLRFTKSNYLGSFYNLFFPSAVGGDLLKWIPLLEHYPHLSKTRLATSVLLDRVVGFTAFALVAMVALIIGKILNYQFPDELLIFFILVNLGVIVFYLVVYLTDIEKIINRFPKLKKVEEIVSIVKKENKKRIFKCLVLSLFSEPIWIMTSFINFWVFKVPIRPLDIFIFAPIISLILVLPISVAGFGARENLYLYFFTQLGIAPEKVLAVSAFAGVMGILNSLVGGLVLLF